MLISTLAVPWTQPTSNPTPLSSHAGTTLPTATLCQDLVRGSTRTSATQGDSSCQTPMSYSPPVRRMAANGSRSQQEDLINAYEAEEERIINVLSRKLEQLRQEKIGLENVLEAESESHVNRLSRELSALRIAQQQLQQQAGSSTQNGTTPSSSGSNGVFSLSPEMKAGFQPFTGRNQPPEPSAEIMLETLRRENEQLRNRLSDTEREFIRITRLNDIYREELIDHRRKLGLPVDNLIGMPSSDPLSQPTHQRRSSLSYSTGSSPSTSVFQVPTLLRSSQAHAVPIPRPPSQVHRPPNHTPLDLNTPLSHSPSSSDSPFPFSPSMSGAGNPASFQSSTTNVTSPPSSASFNQQPPMALSLGRGLSYPSVPPPSLSSSFGSPNISYFMAPRDPSLSPTEPLSRRSSAAMRGSLDRSRGASRRASLDFGARVAETGTLVPRSRAGSQSLQATAEAYDDDKSVDSDDNTSTGIKIGVLDS